MAQRNNIYRRPSGIYVIRITVPARYRSALGRSETHISSHSTNLTYARTLAGYVMSQWRHQIGEMDSMKAEPERLAIALAGHGLVSPVELSIETGMSLDFILRELKNNNIEIAYLASLDQGYAIPDYRALQRETYSDGSPIANSFIIDVAIKFGSINLFSQYLRPVNEKIALSQIIEVGHYDECVFRLPGQKHAAAVFDLPGIRLNAKNILFAKLHFSRHTAIFPSISPSTSTSLQTSASHAVPNTYFECCHAEKAGIQTSAVMEHFLSRKQSRWKPEQQKKMRTHCSTFVELMGDPTIGELNRQLIWDYEEILRRMPADRYQARRRHGTNEPDRLIALAAEKEEPLLSDLTVQRYIDSLSSMLAWATDNMYLTQNPAKRAIEKKRKVVRDQDERSKFEPIDLGKIFSAEWFANGSGERGTQGRFTQFRPHFYWLPLLGLYTGARLNELAQLYISDIRTSDTGAAYLDFNLEEPDKIDVDEPDKSLKTVNARRVIPLHPQLLSLGFMEWVEALSSAGYTRLFPELKRDLVKGYGKPAGSWFNERFLGKKLSIPRDRKRTFHSFRHTFITALNDLEIPADIQSQIAGHSRGDSITATRYRKDLESDKLLPYIQRLEFNLPTIAPFRIPEGLEAIRHALRRKMQSKSLSS